MLHARVIAYDLLLDAYHAWDVARTTWQVSVGGGVSLFDQRFETRGAAPARLSAAPFVSVGLGGELHLPYGMYSSLNFSGETHFLHIAQDARQSQLSIGFAVRATLGFGKHF